MTERRMEIPLTQGKMALVDAEDYEWLSQWKWRAQKDPGGRTWYAMRLVRDTGPGPHRQRVVRMHRLIMGTPAGMGTDHADHDGLHNCRGNLRICTRSQNAANGRLNANNTSGYRGVTWARRQKRWMATIGYKGKNLHLGYFRSGAEAAEAYNEAAVAIFGEFAYLNALAGEGKV